ncbi:MAG: bifunctional hydroxymethylpyrimidine kinase/phosphomethylpyrimidine kinase, partial [Oscillospiraceae bacterium]|nr:bifunctional hydroxymethylpyrimidine kinase/phosphomethylpyrimidine kinase [Oscillospiraceae bacterium]
GLKTIILTGISFEKQTTGVFIAEKNQPIQYYQHKKIAKNCHGTGDIFASTFVGAYLHGFTAYESAKISADYTVSCIEKTKDDSSHWYGVKFELALPELVAKLNAN